MKWFQPSNPQKNSYGHLTFGYRSNCKDSIRRCSIELSYLHNCGVAWGSSASPETYGGFLSVIDDFGVFFFPFGFIETFFEWQKLNQYVYCFIGHTGLFVHNSVDFVRIFCKGGLGDVFASLFPAGSVAAYAGSATLKKISCSVLGPSARG